MNPIELSLIIPVFNRPVEVDELLESLLKQTKSNFEVIIVEDGSTVLCKDIVDKYVSQLSINYLKKPNSGPGQSRNFGADHAHGNYFVFLDSDCIIPEQYIEIVLNKLKTDYIDAYGGPDRALDSFTSFQKAINYSMTSFFTTGGIRGGGEKMDKFFPRSFNMGYSKEVYQSTTGFSKMRFGEDIDMSARIHSNGFKTKLFKNAYVYHKRRSSIKQFFKQVYNSGIARINLHKRHANLLKIVHFLPAVFTVGVLFLIIMSILISWLFLIPIMLHVSMIFISAISLTKNPFVASFAVVTSYIQLIGYGTGFINAFFQRIILKRGEFEAFKNNFYS